MGEGSLRGVVGESVTVSCVSGHGPGGIAVCDGESLTFTNVSCDGSTYCPTMVVANSNVSNGVALTYGEAVFVQCEEGFSGGGTVMCQNSGEYNTTVACNPAGCAAFDKFKACVASSFGCSWNYVDSACQDTI